MDEIDDRTPERKRLDAWSAENPRDQLGMVALAAWLNTTPDKLPKEMRLHTCQATKDAWARVEVAIRADLAQAPAPAPVRVKDLEWHNFDAWTHWAEGACGTYHVEERNGYWQVELRVGGLVHGVTDTDDTTPADLDAAKSAAQQDYDQRIRAALEPDAGVVAELVEALRPLAALPIGPATADDVPLYGLDGIYVTYGDIRRAAAAVAKWEAK